MGANQSTRKITVVNDEASGVIKISDAVVQRLKGELSGEKKQSEIPTKSTSPSPEIIQDPVKETTTSAVVPPTQEVVHQQPPQEVVHQQPPQEVVPPQPPKEVVPEQPSQLPPEPATPPPIVDTSTPSVIETPVSEAKNSPPPPTDDVPPPTYEVNASQQQTSSPHIWQRPIIQYIEEPSLSALRVRAEKEEEIKKLEDYWKNRLQKQEESYIANSKLTEQEILKSVKHVESLFTPASNRDVCRESRIAVQSCYSENPTKPLLCRDKVLEFSNCVSKSRLELLTPSG